MGGQQFRAGGLLVDTGGLDRGHDGGRPAGGTADERGCCGSITDSRTGALSFYERIGMYVRRPYMNWSLDL